MLFNMCSGCAGGLYLHNISTLQLITVKCKLSAIKVLYGKNRLHHSSRMLDLKSTQNGNEMLS